MNTNDTLDRALAEWLREDSEHRIPDHLEAVLVRTIATRQRPWWSIVERWLPARWFSFERPAHLRLYAGLAVAAILVAALIALAVGSQRKLPPPFGPARNGAIVTTIQGDLVRVDPTTGVRTALLANSPDFADFSPMFSRDGRKLLYLRPVIGKGLEIVVANADGSDPMVVSPAVDGLDQVDWSPDGGRIAFLSRILGRGQINLVNADGTGLTTLGVPFPANEISWLPPDGAEILFRGEHQLDKDPLPGIYAIRPDGSPPRLISTRPAVNVDDYQDVSASPDGLHIAYRETGLANRFQVHIVDRQTGADRVLPAPSSTPDQTSPGFSPDGVHVLYLRFHSDSSIHLVVAPLDGSNTGVELPLSGTIGADGPTINNFFFMPDGSAILANELTTRREWLLPIDGSPGTVLAQGSFAYDALSTVQRLAP